MKDELVKLWSSITNLFRLYTTNDVIERRWGPKPTKEVHMDYFGFLWIFVSHSKRINIWLKQMIFIYKLYMNTIHDSIIHDYWIT